MTTSSIQTKSMVYGDGKQFEKSYLTWARYESYSTLEKERFDSWFRGFFAQPRAKVDQPLPVDDLMLLRMLGLYYPETADIRCMGHRDLPEGELLRSKRCQNRLHIENIAGGMKGMWRITHNLDLHGENLQTQVRDECKNFLCLSQHREVAAEKLANDWVSAVLQFREWYLAPQQQHEVPAVDTTTGMEDSKPFIEAEMLAFFR